STATGAVGALVRRLLATRSVVTKVVAATAESATSPLRVRRNAIMRWRAVGGGGRDVSCVISLSMYSMTASAVCTRSAGSFASNVMTRPATPGATLGGSGGGAS